MDKNFKNIALLFFVVLLQFITYNASAKTYIISITSRGRGVVQFNSDVETNKFIRDSSVVYNGELIRDSTIIYTLEESSSFQAHYLPDYGYKMKSVVVNRKAQNGYVYCSDVKSDYTIEIDFELDPKSKFEGPKHSLQITSSGNGIVYFNGESIRNTTKIYELFDSIYALSYFIPDKGHRIKRYIFNGIDYTDGMERYTNTTICGLGSFNAVASVEFEPLPPKTYTITVTAKGNGIVSYNGTSIRSESKKFSIEEGYSPTISFVPDEGNIIKKVVMNGKNIGTNDDHYTISNIKSDVNLEVEFGVLGGEFSIDGIYYEIESTKNRTVVIKQVESKQSIEIPEKITNQGIEWTIEGLDKDVFISNSILSAIIWNPGFAFNASVSNPNLLLYVKDASYAPSAINNVVVNGVANKITLTDSKSGNNFYCPQEFTAMSISYIHSYNMTTGISESRGWETIALPFDVQKITHASRGDLVPYSKWLNNGQSKPFWLYHFTNNGFVATDGIKAYTPYIISMPSNSGYLYEYRLNGSVTFSAENVKIAKSDNVQRASYNGKTFIPNFENQLSNASIYALNVNNDLETYNGTESEGSVFISNLRSIHPFEAYMTSNSGTRSIGIFDDMTTAVDDITIMNEDKGEFKVYDLKGILIRKASSIEEAKKDLPAGMYLINNKKFIIK